MENYDDLLANIIFSDEVTFCLSGKVNRYNVRIWGSENPHATLEVERDSPKLSKQTVYGPFIFEGQTVTGWSYLEMLTNWLIPQLAAERHDYLFQQDGAPPHWHIAVRTFLNEHLPIRWIGRARQNDQVFCKWPPRSADLTDCDSFLWGYVKDRVYVISTTRNRGWAARTHHCRCQLGHAAYAAESLVRARLSHRCLPSNKTGAHWVCVCVIPHETVWVYATVATNFVRIFQ